MKKIVALLLVLVIMCGLVACKKDPPVETTPPEQTLPIVEMPPETQPQEVIPEVEIETMPSAFPEDMNYDQLTAYYADFIQNYDWSGYNGFISETANDQFTYIFTENEFIYDAKLMSQAYIGSIKERYVTHESTTSTTRYSMGDTGSFGRTVEASMLNVHPTKWSLFNAETTSWYVKTEIDKEIYDVVQFETVKGEVSHEEQPERYSVIANGTEFDVIRYNGTWSANNLETRERWTENVSFDPDTKKLTIEGKTYDVEITSFPKEKQDAEQNLKYVRGELYINRQTQEIAYMIDLDNGYTVRFLKDAAIDFALPDNVRQDASIPQNYAYTLSGRHTKDAYRYLDVE